MKSRWIQPDGSEEQHDTPEAPMWSEMQRYVGGNLEIVNVLYKGKKCHMLVHEEGMLVPLPKNPVATEIYYAASRARGVEPTKKRQSDADAEEQLGRLAASLGVPAEIFVTLELGGDMENCIYGPAIVLEGQLQ